MSKNKEGKEIGELEAEVRKAELILQLKKIELETLLIEVEINKSRQQLQAAENPEITT